MLLSSHTMWALECRFPQQTIEKMLSAADHHSARMHFRSIRLTFFFWSWLHWFQTNPWTAKDEYSSYNRTAVQNHLGYEKVHLNVRRAFRLACTWVGFWPQLIKRQRLEKEKNNLRQVYFWGESATWCELGFLASPIAVSVLKYNKAHFPAQVNQGNRLEKPL